MSVCSICGAELSPDVPHQTRDHLAHFRARAESAEAALLQMQEAAKDIASRLDAEKKRADLTEAQLNSALEYADPRRELTRSSEMLTAQGNEMRELRDLFQTERAALLEERKRAEAAELALAAERTLHPVGRCGCAGEGECQFCQLCEYQERFSDEFDVHEKMKARVTTLEKALDLLLKEAVSGATSAFAKEQARTALGRTP